LTIVTTAPASSAPLAATATTYLLTEFFLPLPANAKIFTMLVFSFDVKIIIKQIPIYQHLGLFYFFSLQK
jgi:hypothetical protein